MKLSPILKRVLVRRNSKENISSVIFTKDQSVDNGVVLDKGGLVSDQVVIGETVTWGHWSGHSRDLPDNLMILQEDDILFSHGVLDE